MNSPTKEQSREPLSTRWKRMTDEEKRCRITDAVLSVVSKSGVQGATTARIAATIGVSEPTLYRTFRNRTEMLLAAADKLWQQRRDELESCEASDALDFLSKAWQSHTTGIRKTWAVRFLTELAVAHAGEELTDHIRDLQFGEVQHLAQLVDEGKTQGCIRSDIDTQETAWRIMSVYWLEVMARMHGLEDYVLSGFSTRRYQAILDEIAVEPRSTMTAADHANQPSEPART